MIIHDAKETLRCQEKKLISISFDAKKKRKIKLKINKIKDKKKKKKTWNFSLKIISKNYLGFSQVYTTIYTVINYNV